MALTTQSPPQFLNAPEGVEPFWSLPLFNKRTKKNVMPLDVVDAPSNGTNGVFGTSHTVKLKNRGILGWATLYLEGTFTLNNGTGTSALRAGFPHNVVKRLTLRVNGQDIISCSGVALQAMRQIRGDHHNDPITVTTAPNTTGTPNTFLVPIDVPIMTDQISMIGGLFVESDSTDAELDIQYAPVGDVVTLTGNATASLSFRVRGVQTSFDVPYDRVEGKTRVILPDSLHLVHFIKQEAKAITNNGERSITLPRPNGQMTRALFWFKNGSADIMDPTLFRSVALSWGGNIKALNYRPGYALVDENAFNYDGRLVPNIAALDFLAQNPARDAIMPRAVNELQLEVDLGDITVNTNAEMNVAVESIQSSRPQDYVGPAAAAA